MRDTDFAYAAGLVDGDGCIAISRENRYDRPKPYYFRVNVRVCQTDLEALKWLKETFGGCIYTQNHPRGNRKECWAWSIRNRQGIICFLLGIIPYLKIKQQQALLCLEFYEYTKNNKDFRSKPVIERLAQEDIRNKISALNVCHKVLNRGVI